MRVPKRLMLGLVGLLATVCRAAAPAAECTSGSDDCVAVGRWNASVAVGGGVRTNPLLHGDDIPLVIIPHISYYGEHFFLDDLDLGVSLIETRHMTVSLVASPGYDRVYFYRTDLQNFFITGLTAPALSGFKPHGSLQYTQNSVDAISAGAQEIPSHPRHVTYLAGPEWTFSAERFTAQLDVLHEVTGQNHGNEIRAAAGLAIPAKGTFDVDVGLTWKSAAIVNYYYGWPSVYQGGSALDPFIKMGYMHALSPHWRFNTFVEVEHLADAISDSPIVADRNVVTFFVGSIYQF